MYHHSKHFIPNVSLFIYGSVRAACVVHNSTDSWNCVWVNISEVKRPFPNLLTDNLCSLCAGQDLQSLVAFVWLFSINHNESDCIQTLMKWQLSVSWRCFPHPLSSWKLKYSPYTHCSACLDVWSSTTHPPTYKHPPTHTALYTALAVLQPQCVFNLFPGATS